ncbi:MAG: GMC family oxidoreductase, partial [Rhodospirillales bacterium]|nr:GMC family oxidoreductase [Rhodospirillales bacterium]
NPAMGVVDEHCRVHGTDNLYIAGSSVFPTAGNHAPTLTLIALAFRLSDHLEAQLQPTLSVPSLSLAGDQAKSEQETRSA